jgi:hypothetical protein
LSGDEIVPQFQTLIDGFPASILSMIEQAPPKNEVVAAEWLEMPLIHPTLDCEFVDPGLAINRDASVGRVEVAVESDHAELTELLPDVFVTSGARIL